MQNGGRGAATSEVGHVVHVRNVILFIYYLYSFRALFRGTCEEFEIK